MNRGDVYDRGASVDGGDVGICLIGLDVDGGTSNAKFPCPVLRFKLLYPRPHSPSHLDGEGELVVVGLQEVRHLPGSCQVGRARQTDAEGVQAAPHTTLSQVAGSYRGDQRGVQATGQQHT